MVRLGGQPAVQLVGGGHPFIDVLRIPEIVTNSDRDGSDKLQVLHTLINLLSVRAVADETMKPSA